MEIRRNAELCFQMPGPLRLVVTAKRNDHHQQRAILQVFEGMKHCDIKKNTAQINTVLGKKKYFDRSGGHHMVQNF